MGSSNTSRAGFYKPTPGTSELVDISKLNANWDKVDSAVIPMDANGSGAMPGSPFPNQIVRRSDQRRAYIWNNVQGVWDEVVLGSGPYGTYVINRFTANGTWTKPSGMRAVWVRCVGGGGAGGGCAASTSGQHTKGGGGGGGAYTERWLANADVGSTVSVTVGAGGTGSSGADGGAGGSSSFGGALGASGGSGGTAGTLSSAVAWSGTGGGGGATTGSGTPDLLIPGQTGGSGFGSTVYALSGEGGNSALGSGGAGGTNSTGSGSPSADGLAGRNYGGGGGGAWSSNGGSARAGGNGSIGLVIAVTIL